MDRTRIGRYGGFVADEKRIPATEFKQRCLRLIERVAQTKVPFVVTKHGRPVVRVVPVESIPRESMIGSVTLIAEDPEAYYSTGERWEAELSDE